MAGLREILLPWDSQPQGLFDLNRNHPLASRVIGLWIGSQPAYLAGHGALTSPGVQQAVTRVGVGARVSTYAGTGLVNLPDSNRFRLVGISASIVAGVDAVDDGNNVYQHIWAVRNAGTQIAVFAVGKDTTNYLGGRVAINVAGSDFVGTSGSARFGEHAVYGASWGSSGRTLYVNGAVDSTSANNGVVAASSIVPSLLNRQTGGRGLVGPATFVYLFDGYIGDYWHAEIAANPWQLVEERRIPVPVAAAGGGSLDIDAASLSISGALTASGDLQRDLDLSASPVALAGTLAPSGDIAAYVPMLDVSAGTLAITGSVAATGDIGVGVNLSAGTVALSGTLTASGDLQIGTAFDVAADAVALAGTVTASGDIQIAEEVLLDVAASPLSLSGSVSVAGELAYLVPALDIDAAALALSGSVAASGDITPELHFDIGAGTVALAGSVDIAADLGIGASFDLSTDPIVVSGVAAVSGDPVAEVIDVSAAAVWSYVLANGKTAGQTLIENNEMLRIVMAAVAGTSAGVGTDTETYFGTDGTTPRVIATFDAQGNRSSVTVDGTP